MRGEPENREREVGTMRCDALLFWIVLLPPEAARFGFVFDFDFDFLKGTVVIVAGRVWESGKPDFGFPLFPGAARRSCGNVEISRGWRDFQGAVGRVENLGLVFHAFHRPGISTAVFLLRSIRHHPAHWGPRDFASNASLAICICCAASVSLLRIACCCSIGAAMPGFKHCSHFDSETSFSYDVR